jgi:hypothetical protein
MKTLSKASILAVIVAAMPVVLGACSDGDTDDGSGGKGSGGASAGSTSGSGASGSTGTGSTGSSGGNPDAIVTTCGDQTYAAASPSKGVCAAPTVIKSPSISTFEDGALGWGVYDNEGAGTTTTPATYENGAIVPAAPGANGSGKAIQYLGGKDFPRGLRFNLGYTDCLDVKAFEGISFWAKGTIAAEAPGGWDVAASNLVVQIGSQNSLPTSEGGDCTENCYMHPDARITLTADWKEYRIPFDCFGDGKVFDGHMKSLLFVVRGSTFDVSIDEVNFY